jgi:hypothetical protein
MEHRRMAVRHDGRMLLEGTAAVRRAHDERMSGDQAEVTAA